MTDGWTEAEVERLRREYPVTGTVELAGGMGRSPQALRRKAMNLGLRKADSSRRVRDLGGAGAGSADIARNLGLSRRRVQELLAPPPPPPRDERLPALLVAYEAGPTDALRREIERRILASTWRYADTAEWRYVVDRAEGLKRLRLDRCHPPKMLDRYGPRRKPADHSRPFWKQGVNP